LSGQFLLPNARLSCNYFQQRTLWRAKRHANSLPCQEKTQSARNRCGSGPHCRNWTLRACHIRRWAAGTSLSNGHRSGSSLATPTPRSRTLRTTCALSHHRNRKGRKYRRSRRASGHEAAGDQEHDQHRARKALAGSPERARLAVLAALALRRFVSTGIACGCRRS
jgi:hypothetical protein